MTEPILGMRVCSDDETECPKCHGTDIDRLHHGPSALGECWFWFCNECEHQWGHA